jgi:hypothetical protein
VKSFEQKSCFAPKIFKEKYCFAPNVRTKVLAPIAKMFEQKSCFSQKKKKSLALHPNV